MSVPEISVDELEALDPTTITLIDVREPDEYADARVAGAVLIPLATVPDRIGEINADGVVYVICAAGGRSMQAAEYLAAQGMETVNVAGGTKGWMILGKPVESGPVT